ncbi:hypothetical protein, partial [Bacillus cereus]
IADLVTMILLAVFVGLNSESGQSMWLLLLLFGAGIVIYFVAKLKANKDTFFLPDSNGGVYFRNNASSFRMDGDGIYNWIEKL